MIRRYFLREDVLSERRKGRTGSSHGCGAGIHFPGPKRPLQPQHLQRSLQVPRPDNRSRRNRGQPLQDLYRGAHPEDQGDEKDWVVSVLWDNAGVGRLDEDHYYVITGETHNSPSNMEAYGGSITGIVGIYRDPMGTGKGLQADSGHVRLSVWAIGITTESSPPPSPAPPAGRGHRRREGRRQQKRHPNPIREPAF